MAVWSYKRYFSSGKHQIVEPDCLCEWFFESCWI